MGNYIFALSKYKGEYMQKGVSVSVIDVGSGKITGFVASQVAGDDFNVVAKAEVQCSTFYDGRWIDEESVIQSISSVLKQLAERSESKLSKVYVGVPGEFVAVATKEAEVNYPTPKKLVGENVNEVFNNVENFSANGFSAISRSSIYFVLDDEKKVIDPVGEMASKLSGLISFIFVEDSFKRVVSKALANCGISEFDFVSQNLAQALYLIQPSIRDGYAVLVDCGFVTTNVSVVLGDGVLYSKSFSVGSAQMADDIAQVYGIEHDVADYLLSQVHLNLEYSDADCIVADEKSFSSSTTNEIVRCRVEDIAERIKECLDACPHTIPKNAPVFITGGTFAYLKGGINALAKGLEKAVYPAPINSPQYDKQEYTSAYGLISIALSQTKPVKQGFLKKLLAHFGG